MAGKARRLLSYEHQQGEALSRGEEIIRPLDRREKALEAKCSPEFPPGVFRCSKGGFRCTE
jgi:hypothetical protein